MDDYTPSTTEIRNGWVHGNGAEGADFDRWLANERLDAEEQAFEAMNTTLRQRMGYFARDGRNEDFLHGFREATYGFNHVYGEWQMHNRRGAWAPKPA